MKRQGFVRPKSGLPKRKALRALPKFQFGFRSNPTTKLYRNPFVGLSDVRLDLEPFEVVSLFSGCGGLDLGLLGGFHYLNEHYHILPFKVVKGYDNDCKALDTYRLNLGPGVELCDLSTVDIERLPPAEIMVGGFPCQDFSSCGPKQGFDGKRGRLYKVLSDYMKIHRPQLAIGENVPHLARMKQGVVLDEIANDFRQQGYRVKTWHLYCPNYGLPQHRERVFFVCVRDDLKGFPEEPEQTHFEPPSFFPTYRPIEAAIGDLSRITDESVPNQSQYFVATKATKGAGQGDQHSVKGEVSYAVRANPKARVHFHYELPRRLTVRESARLQSFPDEFVFPHATSSNILNIGNAVPPIVGHAVGRELAKWLMEQRAVEKDKPS